MFIAHSFYSRLERSATCRLMIRWGRNFICNVYYVQCIVAVVLLFYVHGKHLRSCRDGQLT